MINACCNLYFCFIITVHGDIRHLENIFSLAARWLLVHGDIRHLETALRCCGDRHAVHGDIRHLENAVRLLLVEM